MNVADAEINGVLLFDKPLGVTSNQALQTIKRLLKVRKAGHTGTLDPLATGMLPICLGEATKFAQFLLAADKQYQVTMQLGVVTNSGDAEGEIIAQHAVPLLDATQLENVLKRFRGKLQQVPSMYSAIKHQGKPLYQLARQGITVERPPREIIIYKLELLDATAQHVTLEVHCSKGTYIRTLVEDIGTALGCGAHVTALRRLSVGDYQQSMMTLAELEHYSTMQNSAMQIIPDLQSRLIALSSMVPTTWPEVKITNALLFHLRHGQPVLVPKAPTSGWVCLLSMEEHFLGVGEINETGRVAPRRLIS